MFKRRFLLKAFLFLFVTGLIFVGGGVAGWFANEELQKENSLASRVERKATAYLGAVLFKGAQPVETVSTGRLRLTREVVNVPLSVTDSGGGLGLGPGGVLLLLDRRGGFFSIRGDQVEQLSVAAPPNGYDELKAAFDAGELGGTQIRFRGFRYTDLLYVVVNDAPHLLIAYTEWFPERRCFTNTLAKASVDGERPADWIVRAADWEIVKRAEPCIPLRKGAGGMEGVEAGGRLAHLIDSQIIWSSGAYGRDDKYTGDPGDTLAQDDATDYGKLLLVDLATGEIEKIAKGLRNPQGLSVDPNGGIWVTDHGMKGGDELNYTTVWRRPNFGHPVVSYGAHYDGRSISLSGRHEGHDGYDLPVVSFVPAIGPGAALYLDGFDPAWDGDVLIGGFKGEMHRVHAIDGRAIVVEPVPTGVRTRDMQALPDGRFAIWTDNLQIIYYGADKRPSAISQIRGQIAGVRNAALRETTSGLLDACMNCHGFEAGEHLSGPSLHQICGADVASTSFDSYSSALTSAGGVWTRDRLKAFIADPASVAEGTSMAWEGAADAAAAGMLAKVLCFTRY